MKILDVNDEVPGREIFQALCHPRKGTKPLESDLFNNRYSVLFISIDHTVLSLYGDDSETTLDITINGDGWNEIFTELARQLPFHRILTPIELDFCHTIYQGEPHNSLAFLDSFPTITSLSIYTQPRPQNDEATRLAAGIYNKMLDHLRTGQMTNGKGPPLPRLEKLHFNSFTSENVPLDTTGKIAELCRTRNKYGGEPDLPTSGQGLMVYLHAGYIFDDSKNAFISPGPMNIVL